jgi:hypothetical protein
LEASFGDFPRRDTLFRHGTPIVPGENRQSGNTLFYFLPVNNMRERITIVSGLPRSGTSAMMQMLSQAGMEALTDNLRAADKDNPSGYYELEVVQKIRNDTSWLNDAKGKIVKVVSPLLTHLPEDYTYDVIFMRRDLNEIIASQAKMIEHRQSSGAELDSEQLKRTYKNHLKDIYIWMGSKQNMRTLSVNYRDVIDEPAKVAQNLVAFLGSDLDPNAMIAAVDNSLYRNRAPGSQA